uniref:Alsin-like PH-like domain-containing protein n=1 Tax=Monopterus albus TaxID=43700 RepID=A0A3Q3J027_MONAL
MHYCSSADEQDPTPPERGLFHIWQSAGPSKQLGPQSVLLSRPVVQAALGEHHGILLTLGGQVYSFGELLWRDLSIPASNPVLEVTLLGKMVVRVAAGGFHCGALSEQGGVYMWGENTAGQCGPAEGVSEPYPVSVVDSEVIPPAVVRVVDLACGREHSLALSSQNELWAWGSGCQLGLVTNSFPVWRPQKVEHLAGRCVIQVACGAYHSLALVRSLPPQNCTQNLSEKRERGQSPHCSVTEEEELLPPDDSHYCPLGVELAEVMAGEVNNSLRRSSERNRMMNTSFKKIDRTFVLGVFATLKLDLLSYSNSGVSGTYSSSPVCLEEVRLCVEAERKALQGQKSSSLTNLHQNGQSAANRRRSLPGTPTHGKTNSVWTYSDVGDRLPSLETEVWSWGRGSEGQLGHGDQLARLQPLCIKSLTGEEVIKVAAGSHHSLALTAQCQVYSWGSNMCGQLGHVNSPVTVPQQVKLSDGLWVWDMSAGQSHSLLLADGDCVQPILLYCGQQQEPMSEQSGRSLQSQRSCQRSPNRAESYTMGYISSVCSGGQNCALLADQNIMGFISAIHELASRERHLYCWLSSVRKLLLTPLRIRGQTISVLAALFESFVRLSALIGRHATSLSYFLHDVQSHTYLDCLGSRQTILAQLPVADQSASGDTDLVSLLYWPLQQLHQYSRLLLKLATCYDVVRMKLSALFEVLRLPQRRVVCESSNRSLTLQNAGRFSNHWFILFNDVFVHTQFSTHHVYPLTCLWVKPVTEDGSGICAIKITCPEGSFTVVASTPQEKNKWLQSLNQAVDQVLGGGGQGSSPVQTAMSRTASYTFTGEGRFKDAQYTGCWLAGRPHGRGTMKWPDGRMYSGSFKNGLEDGYGECVIPNKVLNKPDSYQGLWRDGKIHGFGKYKYASGEVYEGCFCDGQRYGYGMLSSGKLAKASYSVFIGQWIQDRKTGYGVYDDITRGEKYMGLWLDDQRHGSAVVVTQGGLYYEGTFRENKMSGLGLLVSDDDTAFHGEFSDDWTVSGKVENISFFIYLCALALCHVLYQFVSIKIFCQCVRLFTSLQCNWVFLFRTTTFLFVFCLFLRT